MSTDKQSWWKYTPWVLGLYIVSLLILFPANTAYRFLGEYSSPVKLTHITGTVWNGKAEQLTISDLDLAGFQWSIQPLKIIIGSLAYGIKIQDHNFHLQGNISRTLTGSFTGKNITGQLPADFVSRFTNVPLFGIQGNLLFSLDKIEYNSHVIRQATGKITLQNGTINLPGEISIGTIDADITSNNGEITLHIQDKKAPINITGTLVLKQDRNYKFSILLKPGPSADLALLAMLKKIGNLRQDGSISISYSGSY